MKAILFTIALVATALTQSGYAQDNIKNTQPTQLLTLYYTIKDALVNGNSDIARTKSNEFVTAASSMDENTLPEDSRTALLKDANAISKAKDIKKQRDHFASFSNHIFDLAKAKKISTEPIYKAYCPMKKTSWLSSEAAIKNPYYGNAMLTCGEVVETLK